MRTARISVDATVPCLQLYMELPCWQVRRPEDVGTPDSEAKGRNHPLYFVGSQDPLHNLSCDPIRLQQKSVTEDKEEYYPGRSLIDAVLTSSCRFIAPEISCAITRWVRSLTTTFLSDPWLASNPHSPVENKFWSILRFAKCFPPRRFEPSARRICRTFTTLLPWMRTLCLGCRHLRQRDVQCPKSL